MLVGCTSKGNATAPTYSSQADDSLSVSDWMSNNDISSETSSHIEIISSEEISSANISSDI